MLRELHKKEGISPVPGEWISLDKMLKKAKFGTRMAKVGINKMEGLGVIEKRENPETGQTEYRITPKGAQIGLSFKNLD